MLEAALSPGHTGRAAMVNPVVQAMDGLVDCQTRGLKRLAHRWRATLGRAAPVGYMMRRQRASRWVRFHSLPGSKRYAESRAEQAELIRRHEQAATHVLGPRSVCVLVTWASPRPSYREKEWNRAIQSRLRPFVRIKIDGHDMHFLATTLVWKKGLLRRLMKLCADEKAGPMVMANLQKGTAYAPYDGGADLFLSNRTQARLCWGRYTPWLSAHPSRL